MAGQQQNKPGTAQAGQAGAAGHAAKLTQAGCPTQHAQQIATAIAQGGGDADGLARVAQLAPTFNWGLLAQLVGQFGPSIVGAIISLFGQGGSVPGPQPAP